MARTPTGISGVFGVAEFRVVWLAGVASIVGDQLARVALALLVFARTGSAAATAGVYALTMVPSLVSGVLLSGIADRWPRRTVMVTADVLRAVLVAVMAIPGTPLWLLAVLLVLVQLAAEPFAAAQGAVLPDMLGGRYEAGQAVQLVTHQVCLLAGFAGGGVLVSGLGPHGALAVDAVTFAVSALLLQAGIARYPVGTGTTVGPVRIRVRLAGWAAQIRHGAVMVAGDRRLRTLVGLGWLATFTTVPEGLAVVFAAQANLSTGWVGLLLAAEPAGAVAGALVLRLVPRETRLKWLGMLALGTSVPLLGYLPGPGPVAAVALLFVSGLCAAYQVTAAATFVQLIPADRRGQALGFARAGLIAGQGAGIAVGGLVAQVTGSAATTIAWAGAAGSVLALAVAAAWARLTPSQVAGALPAEK